MVSLTNSMTAWSFYITLWMICFSAHLPIQINLYTLYCLIAHTHTGTPYQRTEVDSIIIMRKYKHWYKKNIPWCIDWHTKMYTDNTRSLIETDQNTITLCIDTKRISHDALIDTQKCTQTILVDWLRQIRIQLHCACVCGGGGGEVTGDIVKWTQTRLTSDVMHIAVDQFYTGVSSVSCNSIVE